MLKIKTDSRKVKNGDTFVALRGINSDGHDYIESAIKNGAVKIVAEEGSYSVQTVIVDDSRKYLEEFLYDEYKSYLEDMKIIVITGTNGKTTTSYLLYEALNRLKVNTSYIGTVGFYKKEKVKDLPNTSPDICDIYDILVDSYESGYKTVVMEVSSQGLSYGRLNKIPFDYAVFTNLTQDHLDYHGTMENYAKAKQQLFYQLKKDGISVINIDDSYHSYYEIGDTRTYGFAGSYYQIKNMELNSFGSSFSVNDMHIRTSLIGKYNVYNVLCATIILDLIGFSKDEIERTIPTLTPPPGRMDMISFHKNTVIIDYAHTPDALENILDCVNDLTHKKVITVVGCGGDRDHEKRPLMGETAGKVADYTIVTTDNPRTEKPEDIISEIEAGISKTKGKYEVVVDRIEAIRKAISIMNKKDIIVLAGKGHEKYQEIGKKKIPFDEKEIVKQILEENKK